jgi:hypothetical protein
MLVVLNGNIAQKTARSAEASREQSAYRSSREPDSMRLCDKHTATAARRGRSDDAERESESLSTAAA